MMGPLTLMSIPTTPTPTPSPLVLATTAIILIEDLLTLTGMAAVVRIMATGTEGTAEAMGPGTEATAEAMGPEGAMDPGARVGMEEEGEGAASSCKNGS
jgi:hypothetical protein